MSDWSYLLGNIYKAIEALMSDGPQSERVKTACLHIFKTPQAFFDSALSTESKETLKKIHEFNDDDPEMFRQKVMALGSFIVSAIQDTSTECRKQYPAT